MSYKNVDCCRFCNSKDLTEYLDLGFQSLANNLLTNKDEWTYDAPLRVLFCNSCTMSMLDCVVPPEILFSNYSYRSGMSEKFKWHCSELTNELYEDEALTKGDLVVDIAGNDGTLLSCYPFLLKRVNVDPAINLCEIAKNRGLETVNKFFGYETALNMSAHYGQAKVITAQNVFAHVNDVWDFMHGVYRLLDTYGIFVVECPWVGSYIENADFSSTYHEHLSYISVAGMCKFIKEFNMKVEKIKYFNNLHTGSIRYYIRKNEGCLNKVSNQWEIQNAIYRETFINEKIKNFQSRVELIRDNLLDLLKKEVRIVGIGQAAKATVMCNYFGLEKYIDIC